MTDVRAAVERAFGSAYAVERELGGGAMSRVFLADDRRLHRRVVVKVLSPDVAAALSAERFEREIRLVAALQEPHIVPVLTAGEIDDGGGGALPYYVMPYVEGRSLRERLAGGPVPVAESVGILRDVARALAYAHAHGVVHRDVKPENVLLSSGTAVVTDFGIAKALAASRTLAPGGTLTEAGTSLGTPAYMAPEQVAGDDVDARADLYAWGVMAYELLAGVHPFAGRRTAQQLMAAHLAEPPAPLGTRAPRVPPALAALVMRCLEKSPAARPDSADDVVATLADPALLAPLLAPLLVPAATAAPPPGRSRRVRTVVAGASLAGLVVIVVLVVLWQRLAARAREAGPRAVAAAVTAATGTAIPTVAVLPFANIGGDAANDYFTDGITDELAHALARVPGLRVAGRASSYAYKGKPAPVPEIGRALGVAGVIEGSVRRAGGRLRVIAQLTSALDDKVLWDSAYESASADVFAVQDSVTGAIVAAMLPTLRGAAADTVAESNRGTRDPRAYDLYLQGRYYWMRRGAANVDRAIADFKRAIAIDPRFARAHAGLAMAYGVLAAYRLDSSDSLGTLTMTSARRAVALDPTLADGQLALGLALENWALQLADAEARYRAGIALDPSSATGHQWLGDVLAARGRTDEAIEALDAARRLDPLAAAPEHALAIALLLARRFPDGERVAREALARDSSPVARYVLGLNLLFGGQPDSAVRALEAALRAEPTTPGVRAVLVLAAAAAGRWRDAERQRAWLRRNDLSGGAERAFAELVFGDREPVVKLLGTHAGRQSWYRSMWTFGCNPLLDPLWSDPRVVASMASIGVPVCPLAHPWPIGAPPA